MASKRPGDDQDPERPKRVRFADLSYSEEERERLASRVEELEMLLRIAKIEINFKDSEKKKLKEEKEALQKENEALKEEKNDLEKENDYLHGRIKDLENRLAVAPIAAPSPPPPPSPPPSPPPLPIVRPAVPIPNRNLNAPSIPKALFIRVTNQFVHPQDDEDEDEEEQLDHRKMNQLRRIFRTAQRLARYANRTTVNDEDVRFAKRFHPN